MKKKLLLNTAFVFCLIASYSQPGTLDPSFGDKGIVRTDFGTPENISLGVSQVLSQNNGNIYIVPRPGSFQTLIIRLLADGTIDSSYGYNGYSQGVGGFAGLCALQSDG